MTTHTFSFQVRGDGNEEFTREELRLLASLDCHLFYQARNLNERET
jgi:hypothetical protein